MVTVSVIIPTYNAGAALMDALDSVMEQTYPLTEVIIVDDGSTDQTRQAVDNYFSAQKKRFFNPQAELYYFYQENRGPAAARNRGIREAKGEYIAFLDSDDLWFPQKLEKQIALALEKNFVMVYTDMTHVEDSEVVFQSYLHEMNYRFFGEGNVYRGLLKENFIFTPTVLLRKDLLEQVQGFDESYRICEDYKLWLTIARDHLIGFIDEPLVTRRRMTTNITHNKLLFHTCGVRLFEEWQRRDELNQQIKDIVKDQLHRRYYALGYYYWHRYDQQNTRLYFRKVMHDKRYSWKARLYVLCSFLPGALISFLRSRRTKADMAKST